MHQAIWTYTLLLILALVGGSHSAHAEEICSGIVINGGDIDLSRNERVLICGAEDVEAWKNVPLNQARFHLKVFLQQRGFFKPAFEVKNNVLYVTPGQRSIARQLRFQGTPEDFDEERKRGVEGQDLTPGLLSSLEDWTQGRLKSVGYACPEVRSQADPETGEILVSMAPGPHQLLTELVREEVPGLRPGVLQRYDAFDLGKEFNADFLQLTTDRLINDGIVQSAHFLTECRPDVGVLARQRLVSGKPRVVTFAVGATTEQFPIFRATWRSVRLGPLGSSMYANSFFSSRIQEGQFGGKYYFLSKLPALFLSPELRVRHEDESSYEVVNSRLRLFLGYSFDDQERNYSFEAGPALNDVHVLEGEGPGHTTFVTIDSRISMMSHYYEYYLASPRAGYWLQFTSSTRREGLESDVSASRWGLEGKILGNWQNFDPPLLVAGLRFRFDTTEVEPGQESLIPPEFRYFLGGDESIRGFGRKELDGLDDNGYLTALYTGWELRLADEVPFGMEPFIFADFAFTGERSYQLDDGYFWSPGVGVRWPTFIGTFRGSAGYGVVKKESERLAGQPSHWQYFLSYGKEF